MPTRVGQTTRLLVAVSTTVVVACGGKEPCPGVVEGASYEVAVGPQAPTKEPTNCQQEWGIADGSTFTARVKALEGDGACLAGVAEIENLEGWSLEEDTTEATGDALLEGFYAGSFGSCSALVSVMLDRDEALPCFEDASKTTDECLLTLLLQPQSAGCPSPCTAFLTTTVTRR